MLRLKVCVLHNITELLLSVHRTATIRSPNRYYPFAEPLLSVRRTAAFRSPTATFRSPTATGAKVHRHRGQSLLLMWNMSFLVMFMRARERESRETACLLTQASLIFFHSFIRIFEVDSNILSLVGRKYSSELDIFSLVYSYI